MKIKIDDLSDPRVEEFLKEHAEIKSMRVSTNHRGQGYASKLLRHILSEATLRGYRKLSLETGSMLFFNPARKLYESFGFKYCSPFSNYKEDPNSVFMSLDFATLVRK